MIRVSMQRIRLWLAVLAMATIVAVLMSSSAQAADDDWIIEGGGWGHGIGLSQYGAYGMALDGYEAPEILAHYYSGATSVAASESLGTSHWIFEDEALWIGLREDVDSVELGAVAGVLSVCQTGDGTDDCGVVDLVMVAGSQWRFEMVPDSNPIRCRFIEPSSGTELDEGDCSADVSWVDNVNLDDLPSVTLVQVDGGRKYAHGTVRLRPNNASVASADAFHVALSVGLEDYLYGIGEVPSSWPEATLETQAIIARSFGVAAATTRAPTGVLPTYRVNKCWCHLVATSVDQNFVGWQKESQGTGAHWGKRWVGGVDATVGTVVTHPSTGDTIISTYYSSSTGGATENNEDVWGGSPRAYARSVDDHWAVEPQVNNPFATWAVTVSSGELLSALNEGWDTVVSARLTTGPPGTVVEFTGSDGGSKVTTTRSGNWFRARFSVRSPYVSGVIAPGTIPPFVDIGGSIHYDSIAFIWQEGITKGCNPPTNDRFCPDGSVTRGQMAAFLNRALDLGAPSKDHFTDDAASVFEGDINRLAEAGITKGCNPPANDRFCPDAKVTRGQMAAFLVRAFGYTDAGDGDLFTDDDGLVFEADIDRLGTAGITKGCNPPTNNRFCPGDVLNREQMAAFLHRALG